MPREGESTFFPAKVPSARRPAIFLKNGRLIVADMGSAFSPLKTLANPARSFPQGDSIQNNF
ncbi:hypothetical protein CXU22_02255 [Akkermansia muciniphila]|uniref:Uncharacterized protein n=1 Tax=Akkermansia muciniphila TaxID=239935 RepID=A0A2N8HGG3_9BACT|nr:hypothetical protein CXU22_02255 [Akkermansia muciniphila]